MAKTKEDYFRSGYATGLAYVAAGKMQSEGYPLTTLTGQSIGVSMCGSWQAMSWKAGFDSARAQDANADAGGESPRVEVNTDHLPSGARGAVKSHIHELLRQMKGCRGTQREDRLRRKVQTLMARHAIQ